MQKTTRFNLIYLVIAVMGVLVLNDLWSRAMGPQRLTYSEFKTLLNEKKIEEVVVTSNEVRGVLKTAEGERKKTFVAVRVDGELSAELEKSGVKFSGIIESTFFATLLSWVVPVLLFFGVWMFLMKRMSARAEGGFMSIGKSKAKIYVENDTKTGFKDVAGADEAKKELEEIVGFLKDPKSGGRLGARLPKGVLLVGPPGTGKTLLARAVAGEAGVPFLSISGSEFVEMFVGVGAARVRDLFEQARSKAPCIIFIDELDALGRARNSSVAFGGHDEKEQTLNQLLVELDGFDPSSGIVLLGATNRPEVLDPALLRAGRFDRQVLVDRPDKVGRAAILAVHAKKIVLAESTRVDEIAALTPGFTGADLANLVNEAALGATRRGKAAVDTADFVEAIERLVAGIEKRTKVISPRERAIVAHHEMGHAIAAAAVGGSDPVQKVSIIPRGMGALGYTMQRPSEDRYIMTREELEGKMTVLLGGRAAEHVIFGHLSTGASDDLMRATEIARTMATRYGMVPSLGHAAFSPDDGGFLGGPGGFSSRKSTSEATASEIDGAIRDLVDRAFDRARAIVVANRALLDSSAKTLLEKETLDSAEISAILAQVKSSPPPMPPITPSPERPVMREAACGTP